MAVTFEKKSDSRRYSRLTQTAIDHYKKWVECEPGDDKAGLMRLRIFTNSLKVLQYSIKFNEDINKTGNDELFKAGEISDKPLCKKDLAQLVNHYSQVADAFNKQSKETQDEKETKLTR